MSILGFKRLPGESLSDDFRGTASGIGGGCCCTMVGLPVRFEASLSPAGPGVFDFRVPVIEGSHVVEPSCTFEFLGGVVSRAEEDCSCFFVSEYVYPKNATAKGPLEVCCSPTSEFNPSCSKQAGASSNSFGLS